MPQDPYGYQMRPQSQQMMPMQQPMYGGGGGGMQPSMQQQQQQQHMMAQGMQPMFAPNMQGMQGLQPMPSMQPQGMGMQPMQGMQPLQPMAMSHGRATMLPSVPTQVPMSLHMQDPAFMAPPAHASAASLAPVPNAQAPVPAPFERAPLPSGTGSAMMSTTHGGEEPTSGMNGSFCSRLLLLF